MTDETNIGIPDSPDLMSESMTESLPISSIQRLEVSDNDVLVLTASVQLTDSEADRAVQGMRWLLGKPELRIIVLDPGSKIGKVVWLGDEGEDEGKLSSAHD